MRSNKTFITLIASFCLSAIAYSVAHADDVLVQHLEFEEMIIQPKMEVIKFDDYEICPRGETIVMDEEEIIAQTQTVPPKEDDGDGANLDVLNANWCLIHPDDVICQDEDEEDDEEGC